MLSASMANATPSILVEDFRDYTTYLMDSLCDAKANFGAWVAFVDQVLAFKRLQTSMSKDHTMMRQMISPAKRNFEVSVWLPPTLLLQRVPTYTN